MNTKIAIITGAFALTTVSLFAQRHGIRVENNQRGHQPQKVVINNHSRQEYNTGTSRRTVVITPVIPRFVIEPRIVIGVNRCKPHHYRDDRPMGLCYDDISLINNRLSDIRMDNERVNYIKDKLDVYLVTTDQLCEMLDYISFESNRLELAKYAYLKTLDVENYDKVYSMLDFNSSKRELDRYIDRQNYCLR